MNGRKVDREQPPYNVGQCSIALGSIEDEPGKKVVLSIGVTTTDNRRRE